MTIVRIKQFRFHINIILNLCQQSVDPVMYIITCHSTIPRMTFNHKKKERKKHINHTGAINEVINRVYLPEQFSCLCGTLEVLLLMVLVRVNVQSGVE